MQIAFSEGGAMEEIWGRILRKRYLSFTIVAMLMVGSSITYSYGEEASGVKYGFSVFGGFGDAVRNQPHMSVYGFLPRIDLALHKNWDLEVEGNYSYWNIQKENDLYFLGFDLNLLFKPIQRKWGSLFLLAGGGLGYDNASRRRVSEIGDSHCGGILQARAGIIYNLGKGWALRGEYRFYHISDPFRKDIGLNTHTFLLGISF
jgi:opacity protein-like surface antigen